MLHDSGAFSTFGKFLRPMFYFILNMCDHNPFK